MFKIINDLTSCILFLPILPNIQIFIIGEFNSEIDNPIAFFELINDLADEFPSEKISRLKYIIQGMYLIRLTLLD